MIDSKWLPAIVRRIRLFGVPSPPVPAGLIIDTSVAASLHPDSQVRLVSGHLTIGKRWEGIGALPGIFNLEQAATISINGTFDICTGCFVTVNRGATLSVGSGYMNYRGTIECFDAISLGSGVIIGPDVVIRDSDNHEVSGGASHKSAPIVIKDNVWIGQRALILKGVEIGSGSVVAAGAVVARSVPPACLVGGVPAKVIRENVSWQ